MTRVNVADATVPTGSELCNATGALYGWYPTARAYEEHKNFKAVMLHE
jgi:hypothetical protein